MRVLVVKTSSMGDVIHTLPALTDAAKIYPDIEFDWIVEEPFQMIPAWHKNVKRIIPLAFRRWRKQWLQALLTGEMKNLWNEVRAVHYDRVIDAQGLLKSALLTRMSRGLKTGYSWTSARESMASIFYQHHANASWSEHAVLRLRTLFAQSLGYSFDETETPDYGIDKSRLAKEKSSDPYCVFLHGTTWETKHWPESFWIQLGHLVAKEGYKIRLLWGNAIEQQRATRIANAVAGAIVSPKLSLSEAASVLAHASGIVAVDTGLGHLAAALAVPTVSLYGPTDPLRTGTLGPRQLHLKADFPCVPCLGRTCTYAGNKEVSPACFSTLSPATVWQNLHSHMLQH